MGKSCYGNARKVYAMIKYSYKICFGKEFIGMFSFVSEFLKF